MQWVRGGHKVAWLNAWLSSAEPLDTVLDHLPDLDLLRDLRQESLVEACLRLVSPGDVPEAITPEHDAAALASGFRIDLLRTETTRELSLVPTNDGWLLASAPGQMHGRDHPQHVGRHLDETLIEVIEEINRLDLVADRTQVEDALGTLDAILYGLQWPRLMSPHRMGLLKKSARVLVILEHALQSDVHSLSVSLSATRAQSLRQLAAPARRAAEAAFAPVR